MSHYRYFVFAYALFMCQSVLAQSVCLPAPRLLTTMPMGGQAGTEFKVTITGESTEEASDLIFSHPAITAEQSEQPNEYTVSIGKNCPAGIYEARVMTRLGLSAARVFSVGTLPEVTQAKHSIDVASALKVEVNSICNAWLPARAANHYAFDAKQGQRILIDCAATGIDSKLKPVVIVGDADGNDLVAERRGGVIDFYVPNDATYTVKVHDLTFNGGTPYFYRLAIRELRTDDPILRMPSTRGVHQHSWPPEGLSKVAAANETEDEIQKVTLPCDIAGSFFPSADVDVYEFTAHQGETWWIEVASHRLGRPTDPMVVVQRVKTDGDTETLVDFAELGDIDSPVKVSSNGYSYDGPPYNAGSSDVLGKIEIKETGTYRLQMTDLFGGTRNDPNNVYRLVIRKATPDFSVVAWALHMQLRNGDRNALSKPIALRKGWSMPLEVVVVRRDGFDGEINLEMQDLPDGVVASGVKIPAKQTRGYMIIAADQGAPQGYGNAKLIATASIDDQPVTRECAWASMSWPVRNARNELPTPRLLKTMPVSVSDAIAPLAIIPKEPKVWEAIAGQKLSIPLIHMRAEPFSGKAINMKTFGGPFASFKFDLPLDADSSTAEIDLSKIKVPPGDYTFAMYGSAVAKHKHYEQGIPIAQAAHDKAKQELDAIVAQEKLLSKQAGVASGDAKADLQKRLTEATNQKTVATTKLTAAASRLRAAQKAAAQKDIAEIVATHPISVRVLPEVKK